MMKCITTRGYKVIFVSTHSGMNFGYGLFRKCGTQLSFAQNLNFEFYSKCTTTHNAVKVMLDLFFFQLDGLAT